MSILKQLKTYQSFLSEFVSKPMMTGSIVPSSIPLAKELLRDLDPSKLKLIIEVGPGSGAITHQLLDSQELHSRYFGLDINPVFIEQLNYIYPGVNFKVGSAEHLKEFLFASGLGLGDFIVSGLPWSLINHERQKNILDNIYDSLAPGGEFATFSYVYTPLMKYGRTFLDLLYSRFKKVEKSQVIWQNFPPAFVFKCKKD